MALKPERLFYASQNDETGFCADFPVIVQNEVFVQSPPRGGWKYLLRCLRTKSDEGNAMLLASQTNT